MLVTKRDRLSAGDSYFRDIGRPVERHEREHQRHDHTDPAENTDSRDRVGARMKDLRHRHRRTANGRAPWGRRKFLSPLMTPSKISGTAHTTLRQSLKRSANNPRASRTKQRPNQMSSRKTEARRPIACIFEIVKNSAARERAAESFDFPPDGKIQPCLRSPSS